MNKKALGEILIDKKLITQEQLNNALRIQTGGNRRLGYILIKMKLITDGELVEALSGQYDIPIVDIDKEISNEVKQILPKYICKKYGVIPLSIGNDNILKLAMVNPLDDEAINDIDHYSGHLIWPVLAKQNHISKSINKHIPISARDIFYPLVYSKVARFITIIMLLLLLAVGILLYREIRLEKYGTISYSKNLVVFSNHEILVGVEKQGTISLIGHGPYSKGFYSVVFKTPEGIKNFINEKKEKFSEKQYKWLLWVINDNL